ncbi:putative rossmann-like alpha/beta/alpha sandwich protein [Helianthus debilis subsp. tardiflorus]
MTLSIDNGGGKTPQRQKVMVVAEPTRESAVALHYVLSHVVFDNDVLYLLHVENPTFWNSCFKKQSSSTTITAAREGGGCHGCGCIGGDFDFLDQMKSACELVNPRLKVKVARVETDAKDKAYMIISQTNMLGIDLLVVGKRHSLANAILRQRRNGPTRGETAEYLVENSKCTCVAVQRKGQTGGYLLHTKNHRNFWLLA